MDKDQKLKIFVESLGNNVDTDFATQVLTAHDWDLQAALNTVMGDGNSGAAPLHQGETDAEGYRAPMRTGYTDTLLGPTSIQQERRRLAQLELDRQKLEEERAAQAERQRLASERAIHEQQATQVNQQLLEAERLAFERKKAKQREEIERRRIQNAEAERKKCAEAERKRSAEVQAQPSQEPEAKQHHSESVSPEVVLEAKKQEHEAEQQQAAQEQRLEAEAQKLREKELEELQRERAESEARQAPVATKEKESDGVVQAFVALRRRYKDTDPNGLATCLQTLRVYINNLARNPHEPKFQRINCDNAAFRSRVAAYDGAIDVLIAVGFREEGSALAVGPDFLKTKGPRVWDALAKVDVIIEQLKK